MPKIVIIGAGSMVFTRRLVTDILSVPSLSDSTLTLVDIDPRRLDSARVMVERIAKASGTKTQIEATLSREAALPGATYVITTILVGGVDVFRPEVLIPIKHGVDVNIGDTLGPSGVFRALRTIPEMLKIVADMETHCPHAFLLNYTNPMSMLCRAIQRASSIRTVGLCHSVQGTATMLAGWVDVAIEEIVFLCAGINHQAWFLKFEHDGRDLIPDLRQAIETKQIRSAELVRNEMFRHLGYYVTESSGHNSEYTPWFRKRKDLYEQYCVNGTNWNPGKRKYILDLYVEQEEQLAAEQQADKEQQPVNLNRSHEYCSYILEAMEENVPITINGNVRNTELITNLPQDCCVEVPIHIDRNGFKPIPVGNLPLQLAAVNQPSVTVQEMAVEAHFSGNRDLVYQACYFDPLSAAVLSLDEIDAMVEELFESQTKYLPQF